MGGGEEMERVRWGVQDRWKGGERMGGAYVCMYVYTYVCVAVPSRNRILFHCVFRVHHRV